MKVSGATAGAAAEWSALKWPPSPAASSRAVQNGGHRRSRAGRPFFSVSSGLLALGNSSSLFSIPVAGGVGGSWQPWRSMAVFVAVGGRPPRGPGRDGPRRACARTWRERGRAARAAGIKASYPDVEENILRKPHRAEGEKTRPSTACQMSFGAGFRGEPELGMQCNYLNPERKMFAPKFAETPPSS